MTTINYEKEIQKLKKLKNIINNIPNNKMKMILVYNYEMLSKYLIDLGYLDNDFITKTIPLEFEDYEHKLDKIPNRKYYKSFYDNHDLIYEIINKNIKLYNEYPIMLLPSLNKIYTRISHKELQKIINEFFISLGLDVYNVYQNVGNNYLTFSKEMDEKYLGFTFDISFHDYPHVIVDSTRNLYQIGETLVHEIGHCYDMVRNKTNSDLYYYNMLSEVPSILFQKMFDLFLYEMGYYKNDALNNLLNWKYTIISMNLGCSLIKETSFYGKETDLNYDSEMDVLLETIWKLDENTLHAIEFHPVLFENYRYILGDVIANNLLSIYKENPKEGLKEIKNFIATINQYPVYEHLIKYGIETSETEKEMNKLYQFQKKNLHL